MLLRSSLFATALLAPVFQVAAQGCVLITDKPPDLRGVQQYISRIADDGPSARNSEKPAHLKRSLVILYEDTKDIENQIGRNYLLGRIYAVWLNINLPGTKAIVQRKELNLLGNPNGMHDLYASLDTAFSKVEALNPACVDSTSKYRATISQMAYNAALEQLQAKSYDSAVVLARRALVADPKGAAPWNVLAEANKQRGDTAGFKEALRKVSQAPGNDPAVVRVKGQAYYNLAIMRLTEASTLKGEAQKTAATEAEADLREFLKLQPDDPQGQIALARALQFKGDTAAAQAQMDEMTKNPEKFSATALFEAAGAQYTAGDYDDAIRLYEVGLSKNPMFRDGLFSYASALIKDENVEKSLAVARKLMQVDPNSQLTLGQVAAAWSLAYKKADEAGQKAIQDSLIFYTAAFKEAPLYARVNTFTPTQEGATIDGQINNNQDAPKSYTIEFEFLNASGAVVSSASAPVTDIPAKTGKAFSIKGTGAGIVAWRYKPLKP